MVKIGPVKEESLKFSQAVYPESEVELKEIVKICIRNKYTFAVPVLKKPIELESTITAEKYVLETVVLIFHDHCDSILKKVELSLSEDDNYGSC